MLKATFKSLPFQSAAFMGYYSTNGFFMGVDYDAKSQKLLSSLAPVSTSVSAKSSPTSIYMFDLPSLSPVRSMKWDIQKRPYFSESLVYNEVKVSDPFSTILGSNAVACTKQYSYTDSTKFAIVTFNLLPLRDILINSTLDGQFSYAFTSKGLIVATSEPSFSSNALSYASDSKNTLILESFKLLSTSSISNDTADIFLPQAGCSMSVKFIKYKDFLLDTALSGGRIDDPYLTIITIDKRDDSLWGNVQRYSRKYVPSSFETLKAPMFQTIRAKAESVRKWLSG